MCTPRRGNSLCKGLEAPRDTGAGSVGWPLSGLSIRGQGPEKIKTSFQQIVACQCCACCYARANRPHTHWLVSAENSHSATCSRTCGRASATSYHSGRALKAKPKPAAQSSQGGVFQVRRTARAEAFCWAKWARRNYVPSNLHGRACLGA